MITVGGIPLSILVLIAVFVLIAVRQVGNVRLKIWQIMLVGAVVVLVTGEIDLVSAAYAINLDVMFFLFGMFVIGEALYRSGYLAHLSHRLFKRAANVDQLVLLILFGVGGLSAILMNDTLAIIGTPLVLIFARKYGISPKLLLLALAIAVTTGSVMSPIGNPQNLLIALDGGFENPFVSFFSVLAIPTLINLFIAFLVLRLFYRDEFKGGSLSHSDEPLKDERLAALCKVSLILVFALIFVKIGLVFFGYGDEMRLTYIALVAMVPILFSGRRVEVVRRIDWPTLVFFAAMFVLMESVWESSFLQDNLSAVDLDSPPVIMSFSALVSQLVSNVPFVALYLPLIVPSGQTGMLALAAGSTIAGNMLILGAASNVIIIQNAEKEGQIIKFLEFAKVGVPLTAMNIAVYWAFFEFL